MDRVKLAARRGRHNCRDHCPVYVQLCGRRSCRRSSGSHRGLGVHRDGLPVAVLPMPMLPIPLTLLRLLLVLLLVRVHRLRLRRRDRKVVNHSIRGVHLRVLCRLQGVLGPRRDWYGLPLYCAMAKDRIGRWGWRWPGGVVTLGFQSAFSLDGGNGNSKGASGPCINTTVMASYSAADRRQASINPLFGEPSWVANSDVASSGFGLEDVNWHLLRCILSATFFRTVYRIFLSKFCSFSFSLNLINDATGVGNSTSEAG